MRSRFTTGLLIGGMIGTSIGMLSNCEVMKSKKNKRMMKVGRNLLRKSGNVVENVIDMFR